MTEPGLLRNLRARAAKAQSLIRQFELSNSSLDGPASRSARTALLDLAEIAMPDVVLALLDERRLLIDKCEKAESVIRALVASADLSVTTPERFAEAMEGARVWLDDPPMVGREASAPQDN